MDLSKRNQIDEGKLIDIKFSAYNEFARVGYDMASTNNIVKEAGISKGLLFYYFKNKQRLYQILVDDVMQMLEEMIDKMNGDEPDLLLRYYKLALVEMEYYHNHKELFQFMGSLIKNPISLLTDDTQEKYHNLILKFTAKAKNKENIDTSLFQTQNTSEDIITIIDYAIQGYEQKLRQTFAHSDFTEAEFDETMNEFSNYLTILRKQFYKEEYQ
jgi:AcrR family transcriptional regulator